MKDVLRYNFCPRIIYFENVLKIPQSVTTKEKKGAEAHISFLPRAKRNQLVKKTTYNLKLFNVPLFSSKLNLETVADCILVDTNKKIGIPMQFKYRKKPPYIYRTMKYQIIAEAIMIEDSFALSCPYGLIKFIPEEQTILIKIREQDKEEFKKQLDEILLMIRQEKYPAGPRTKNFCTDCCYYRKLCSGYVSGD